MNKSIGLVVGLLFFFMSSTAFSIGLPKVPGIGKKDDAPAEAAGPSAAEAQDALLSQFSSALDNLLSAQALLIKSGAVKGMSDAKAAELESATGECKAKDCLEKKVALSNELTEATEGMKEEELALTEEGKALYRQALPKYAKGTLEMAQIVPVAKDWLKSATDEIKSAGFRGAPKLKKQLDAGMYVAKNIPKLAKTFGSSTKRVIRVGKANKIEAEGANEADFG